jgi:transposase
VRKGLVMSKAGSLVKPGPKLGRPSKLTPETQVALLEGIELGLSYERACSLAGIHYATLRRWIVKGETAKSGEFREFCEALRGAEARGVAAMLELIRQSANEGQWRAAAWILERRYPEHYGVGSVSVKLSGKDAGPIRQEVEIADARESSFERLFAELASLE